TGSPSASIRRIVQLLLFNVDPAAPACACEHAVCPGASTGHVSSAFPIIVTLPVSFVLNRGVNARSAYAGDANTPTHTNTAAATTSRRDRRNPPGLAADEPGSSTPVDLLIAAQRIPAPRPPSCRSLIRRPRPQE